ncbi:probable pectinesterase 55 [Zingiber officinale]|uniref:probable pectinesterase 55 n=1 Tax=Zingiber officinale TaxID=94328 RepID=UPI001C4D004E|nr:probable pectinesterase 55 [Zingiber officinale]
MEYIVYACGGNRCVCIDGAASISKFITVDQNGHGNFITIQSAIDSIPDGNQQWVQIYIKQGTYREKVLIRASKPFIVLQGEGASNTIIDWNDHGDTKNCATFIVYASDFVARDITFSNSYNWNYQAPEVAEAALVGGDRNSFYRCHFLGHQDTLCDYLGRHFYYGCWIEGSVDFIFGFAQSIYEKCTLHSNGKGWLIANAKDNQNSPTGFVFKYCIIRTSDESTYLGRAWNEWSTVIFFETYMPANIQPQGWQGWSHTTIIEQGCLGPGSDKSRRVSWLKNNQSISHFVSDKFIGPDNWLSQQP